MISHFVIGCKFKCARETANQDIIDGIGEAVEFYASAPARTPLVPRRTSTRAPLFSSIHSMPINCKAFGPFRLPRER